jgi:hypothetical protein
MDTAIALSWTLGIILGLMTLLFILPDRADLESTGRFK